MSELWSFVVVDDDGFPCDAMRHNPSGVVFYMPPAERPGEPVCEEPPAAKKGRGWNQQKMEERAAAEYNRLIAAGDRRFRIDAMAAFLTAASHREEAPPYPLRKRKSHS